MNFFSILFNREIECSMRSRLHTEKTVQYDGNKISIGSHIISELKLHCICVRSFYFLKNKWRSVYFSVDSEDYDPNDLLSKNIFNYTKKHTEKVWEFLNMLNVKIIEMDSSFNKHSEQTKCETKQLNNIILCHHCGSKDIQFIQNNHKNFSVGKPVTGAALADFAEKMEIMSSSASPVIELLNIKLNN